MRPDNGTRLIAAYDAVTAALTNVMAPLDVEVFDGPRGARNMPNDALMLGVGAEAGMNLRRARAGLGARITESFDLHCVLSTLRGDEDLPARRQRIEQLLDLIAETVCTQRPVIPQVLDSLEFGEEMAMEQALTVDGAVIEVAFTLIGRILR